MYSMHNMGNCTSQAKQQAQNLTTGTRTERSIDGKKHQRSLRHCVSTLVPDDTISALYPLDDNYVLDPVTNTRSPKTLQALCVDNICRSLPLLDGEFPRGVPSDVVNDIVSSLESHCALTAATLRALRHCEAQQLILLSSRGVTDEWLQPFSRITTATAAKTSLIGTVAIAHHDQICIVEQKVSPPPPPPPPPIITGTSTSSTLASSLTILDLRGSTLLSDWGLLQLGPMEALQICKLDGCHSITGRGLSVLAQSNILHTLSLANCRRLEDDSMMNLSHLTTLEHLLLDGCRCLTNVSLQALSQLYQLRRLDLSQCDLLTDQGLDFLLDLEGLEELSLGWCHQITDAGLDRLTCQPGRDECLLVLRLARCPLTDDGVAYLGRLRRLEELDLNGCVSLGSAAVGDVLSKLKHLHTLDVSFVPGILSVSWQDKIQNVRTLDLCYSGVQDGHMSQFTSLPALEELNLDSCPCGDWTIGHFADNNVVPNLMKLDLADTDLTDIGMVHLAKFEKLTRLSLFHCNITNSGLCQVANMTNLEVLNLDGRDISDDGLVHLKSLKKLRSLDIFSGRVSDNGCHSISQIQSLESLELCGGAIGDRGCIHLATLTNLVSLNLSQNDRITNQGAAALASLSTLKALNLSNTRVTVDALKILSALVNLQSLAMYRCRGMDNDSEVAAFQDRLPALKCMRLNVDRLAIDGTFLNASDNIEEEEEGNVGEHWGGASGDEEMNDDDEEINTEDGSQFEEESIDSDDY